MSVEILQGGVRNTRKCVTGQVRRKGINKKMEWSNQQAHFRLQAHPLHNHGQPSLGRSRRGRNRAGVGMYWFLLILRGDKNLGPSTLVGGQPSKRLERAQKTWSIAALLLQFAISYFFLRRAFTLVCKHQIQNEPNLLKKKTTKTEQEQIDQGFQFLKLRVSYIELHISTYTTYFSLYSSQLMDTNHSR